MSIVGSSEFNGNTETVNRQVETMIELDSVSKTYLHRHHALFNVNLQVQKGEFLFITGASGSGKSTLLKMLYGAELPTQGKVIVDNINVATLEN